MPTSSRHSRFIWLQWCAAATILASQVFPAIAEIDCNTNQIGFALENRTDKSGISFVHKNGAAGHYYFPEIAGAGVALVDMDNDGDLDAYLVQSGPHQRPGKTSNNNADEVFQNLGDGHFKSWPGAKNWVASGYGMGIAVADVNNDGWIDLFVTNYGRNQLLINQSGSGFQDMSQAFGILGSKWSTSASFLDYDQDGWVDLYVTNYVDFDFQEKKSCMVRNGKKDYCGPNAYNAQRDVLYKNENGQRFVVVTSETLSEPPVGPGLGVVSGDFNNDGLLDLYVANDGSRNFLWINTGDGHFEERGVLSGVALNMSGAAEASMGVDAGDFDNDGDLDLFLSHLARETNTLYVNEGGGWFHDATDLSGLGAPSRSFTGFGTRWVDLDLDGWKDIVVVNGAVKRQQKAGSFSYQQSDQVFLNKQGERFVNVSNCVLKDPQTPSVGRGLAIGDVDNDGDQDLLINNNNGAASLFINTLNPKANWVGLDLRAGHLAVAHHAVIEVLRESGQRESYRVRTDGSYASASDHRLVVPSFPGNGIKSIEVSIGDKKKWLLPPFGKGQYRVVHF